MNRSRELLIVIGVACALPGSAYVLGQGQPPEVPQTTIIVKAFREAEKKVVGKAEVGKKAAAPAKDAVKQAPAKRVEVRKAAVAVRAVRLQAAAAGIDAQVAQFTEQFRALFRVEYYFIRGVCELTKDQRKQLAHLGEPTVKTVARQFVEGQQKMMRGGFRPGMQQYPDARKLMEEELTKATAGFLTPEQQSRYRQEVEQREASRKKLVIDNLVAKLDQELVLTSEQRESMVKALAAKWDKNWGQSLDMLTNIDNFFPAVPDEAVAPILTDAQKEVWRRFPRNQNVFFGVNIGMGGIMENDPLDDPELVEARKEALANENKKK